MAATNKSKSKKATQKATKTPKKTQKTSKNQNKIVKWFSARWQKIKTRQQNFLSRRPHRSFKRTKKRDYKRSLKLPGYWSLTSQVFRLLCKNWRTFLSLILVYTIVSVVLSTVISQDTYTQLRSLIDEANPDQILGTVLPTLTVFWGILAGQVTGSMSSASDLPLQITSALVGLFIWLSTVWLVRSIMAGHRPKMRDGLYSSGGPVIALFFLLIVAAIQLVPGAIAILSYSAALSSGLLDQTVILMLFGGGGIALIVLSLYWVVGTLVAMVIVNLPGMYPLRALKLAGDVVVGRRMRVVLRLLWALLVVLLIWLVVLIPLILIDGALKSAIPDLDWLPLIPMSALLLMSFSIVFMASYVYFFYRRVVADESLPA